jgi:hypothetical protein
MNARVRPLAVLLGSLVIGGAPLATRDVAAQAVPDLLLGGGYDLDTTPVAEALDLALDLALGEDYVAHTIQQAGDSADPAHIQPLKQIAELYGTNPLHVGLAVAALDAAWRLGEPEGYFVGLARRGPAAITISEAAIRVLTRAARASLLPVLDSLVTVVEGSGVSALEKAGYRELVRGYSALVQYAAELEEGPMRVEFDALLDYLMGALGSTSFSDDGSFVIHRGDLYGDLDYRTRWAERRLAEMARTHPTATQLFVDSLSENVEFVELYAEYSPAVAGAAFEAYVRSQAFPQGFPVPPPVADPTANINPVVECVVENGDGTYTAYFAYNNQSGQPYTAPYGVENRVTPLSYDREQPEVFMTGRTPHYPGYAFRVRFNAGEAVRWRLQGSTKRIDTTTVRCPSN